MKNKLLLLLAISLTFSVFTAKAAPAEPQLFFTGVSNAVNNYFGGYLCTWTTVTENGNTFGRFTRPANAALTYGPQWGYVDFISIPSQQTYPYSIAGGNLTFGTNQASYWEYITVRMRKNTTGAPQINLLSQTQSATITSATSVVVGEWVSYLFDVTATSGTAYKRLTVIPDKDNAACTADIDDVYATNAPLTVTTTVNDVAMGSVSGGGSYPTANSAILTATPKAGYRFVNWTNVATSLSVSTAATYSYTLTGGAIALQANFVAGYTIAATSNDVSKGTVAGAGGFDGSTDISLTATVITGNRFIGWVENGTLVSTSLVYTFTPNANRILIAYFGVDATNYISAAPTALTYIYGTTGDKGAKGSFAIDYLGSGDVVVTLPSTPAYEISITDGSGYKDGPITLTANASGNVPFTTIYVRLKDGLAYAATYANTVTITPTIGTAATISLTGSVSKKAIFLNTTNVRRYNGTTTASGISGTLVGVVGSDDVTINGTGVFSASSVGTFKTVTVNLIGTAAGNYTCSPIIGHIYSKWLNVGLVSPSSKVYDGATTSTLPTGTLTAIGTAETSAAGTENDGKPYTGEAVTISGTSVTLAAYNNANLANAYQIVYTGLTIGGAQSANYTFAYPSTITPKAVTVTSASKVYDGTTIATTTLNGRPSVDASTISLNGTLAFSEANVGIAKAVSIATPFSLSSTIVNIGTTNYTLTQPTGLTADITTKPLTIATPAALTKVYDGNNTATITGTLTGVVGADDVTLVGTGTFADVNIGTGIAVTSTSTLAGAKAGNYSLTQPTGLVADISKITGINQLVDNGLLIVRGRTIQLQNAATSVEVFNAIGATVYNQNNVATSASIYLAHGGVYVVKVRSENGVKVQKIFVQ
ncbi:MAG: YDG domain-containing protein [Paludibacter sp.]